MNAEILENRLVSFAALANNLCEQIKKSDLGVSLSKQLSRSSLSPALNYGEAQAAESRSDFIHKIKIALKELRESRVALKIVRQAELCRNLALLEKAEDECNQLISILVVSLKTAQRNKAQNPK